MQLENLAGVVFHREGGLKLTRRFSDGEMPVITPDAWKGDAPDEKITFASGCHLESAVTVHEFIPQEADAQGRWFTDKAGAHHWVSLPSYGVVDPAAYLLFLRSTFPLEMRAWAATQSPAHVEALALIDKYAASDLETLLYYDFGRHQKTRSAFLTGDNTLNIDKLPEDSETMPGQRPLPRMVTAQCDNVMTIYLEEMLDDLFGKDGNGKLSKRLLSTEPIDVHIGYVATRILTQGTVWILEDKVRRDLQNNSDDTSLQDRLQDSLNRLLANFFQVHRGIVYSDLISKLPVESRKFYDTIASEAAELAASTTEMEPWRSPLYWLPPLSEVVEAREQFEPIEVF